MVVQDLRTMVYFSKTSYFDASLIMCKNLSRRQLAACSAEGLLLV